MGLMPTMPEAEDGLMIEPSVSVPSAATHRLAETLTPEPELEPPGLRSRTCGLWVCLPRPLQPLDERVDRCGNPVRRGTVLRAQGTQALAFLRRFHQMTL